MVLPTPDRPVAAQSNHADLIVHAGYLVTLDPQQPTIENGAVAVVGGTFAAVGTSEDVQRQYPTAELVIDNAGSLLQPGLIDAHTHLFQVLGRGLGDGLALIAWLQEFMLPLALNVESEDAVAGARLAALAAALSGTTSVVDNHYAPTDAATTLAVADAVDEVGLRGAIARGVFGGPNRGGELMGVPAELFRYTRAEELEIMRECILERPSGSRVQIWPAPENVVYVDPDLIVDCAQLAAESGLRWHTHCSESAAEVALFSEVHGERPVEWMARAGILDERATLAHAIWLDDGEIELMGEARAAAIHNPVSNQYLASGVIRLRDLLGAGATVALGSDGVAVGGQHMFEAMKAAYLLQRIDSLNPAWPSAEQVFDLACTHGARVLGQNTGRIASGAKADFVVMDLASPLQQPALRPVTNNALNGGSSEVLHVVVDGEVIVRDRRSTRVDHDEVVSKAAEAAKRVAGRSGAGDLMRGWNSEALRLPAK